MCLRDGLWHRCIRLRGRPPGCSGDIAQELAYKTHALVLIVYHEVSHTRFGRVDGCAAELLLCDGLAGYGLDNLGACHEHVAGALAHD